MGIAFVPVYISYLGVEAYGLIGVFLSLQALFIVLDMGLTPSLSREMARINGGCIKKKESTELFFSLEVIYILIILVTVCVLFLVSPSLTKSFINFSNLSAEDVDSSLKVMGWVVVFRWLGALYRGVLIGLQRQVWINANNIIFSTLRGAGVILVLHCISNTIVAFFVWQALVYAVESVVLRVRVKHLVFYPHTRRFNSRVVRKIWRFAAGITFINILSVVITQSDKVAIAKSFPLLDVGYYTMAVTVSSVIFIIVTPIYSSIFPRLTELVKSEKWGTLSKEYVVVFELMSCIVIPVCCVISIFSMQLLYLWSQDEMLSYMSAPILSVMILGSMLNGLMHIPFALQLSMGWTRLTMMLNLCVVVVFIPVMWLSIVDYGPIGGAVYWLLLTTFTTFTSVFWMHGRVLPDVLLTWLFKGVLVPMTISITVCKLLYYIGDFNSVSVGWSALIYIGGGVFLSFFLCALASGSCRSVVIKATTYNFWKKLYGR